MMAIKWDLSECENTKFKRCVSCRDDSYVRKRERRKGEREKNIRTLEDVAVVDLAEIRRKEKKKKKCGALLVQNSTVLFYKGKSPYEIRFGALLTCTQVSVHFASRE